MKPPDFDPSKKYPLILEIHGGPQAMYNVAFNFGLQNFAANDFVVLYTNPRGSTGYGREVQERDQARVSGRGLRRPDGGRRHDGREGYIDTEAHVRRRLLRAAACSRLDGRPHRPLRGAAVRCPVIDWMSFVGETDIPFFSTASFEKPFWEDPKPWLNHSPIMYVGNVKTPTLLMTGVLDMRTPMPQTEEFYARSRCAAFRRR